MCNNKFLIVGLGNPEKKLEFTRHNIGKFFVNRIAEEYGGTNWITKNSYGGSVSLLNYKVKRREIIKGKKGKKNNNFDSEKILKENQNQSQNEINLKNNIIEEQQELNEQLENKNNEVTFQLYFLKPKYYINESGKGILKAVKKFDIPNENVIIIHDNLDKKLGHVQLKECGSANGHNGIRSTIECLGTDKFYRIRIGIDRPPKTDKNKAIYNTLVGDYVLEPFKEKEFIIINNEIFNKVIDILKELAYKKMEQLTNKIS
ncbi:peptidyl-tRNA hydrolase [Anaeromyces robustus]|uniref:peptidyl-tRNA hydrolase n=1 Tax=Anaeromyces robustus TaxID=1754192 RepID=A0A1Y1X793_9FUNG|nr:peptidyl-tRNA hydrolase [Anaeromyces robustus]|eukprot:ORX81592.1 peptidyl-tRNA hydrolase [Anaeromyces robustus]